MMLPIIALVTGAAIGLTWRGVGPTLPAAGPRPDAVSAPVSSPRTPPQTIVITSVRDDGDSIRLAWIDPTAGRAQFVVTQVFDDAPARVYSVPSGQSETVITDLDPNAPRYCFRVLAVLGGPDKVATSAVTCTGRLDGA